MSDSLCLSLLDSEEATLALRCWMGRWLGVLEAALLRLERGGTLCAWVDQALVVRQGGGPQGLAGSSAGGAVDRGVCSAFLWLLLLWDCRSSASGFVGGGVGVDWWSVRRRRARVCGSTCLPWSLWVVGTRR